MASVVQLSPTADRALCAAFSAYLKRLDEPARLKLLGERRWAFAALGEPLQSNMLLDVQAAYSLTEQRMAEEVCELIARHTGGAVRVVTDATAGAGGNTISFARHFSHVYAFEIDATRAKYLSHNVACTCEPDRVTVLHGDYTLAHGCVRQDLVFLDPPWGGEGYRRHDSLQLSLSGTDLAAVCRPLAARFVAIKTPFDFAFSAFQRDTADFLSLRVMQPIGVTRDGHASFVLLLFERQ
jgi:predicted RNA methylase